MSDQFSSERIDDLIGGGTDFFGEAFDLLQPISEPVEDLKAIAALDVTNSSLCYYDSTGKHQKFPDGSSTSTDDGPFFTENGGNGAPDDVFLFNTFISQPLEDKTGNLGTISYPQRNNDSIDDMQNLTDRPSSHSDSIGKTTHVITHTGRTQESVNQYCDTLSSAISSSGYGEAFLGYQEPFNQSFATSTTPATSSYHSENSGQEHDNLSWGTLSSAVSSCRNNGHQQSVYPYPTDPSCDNYSPRINHEESVYRSTGTTHSLVGSPDPVIKKFPMKDCAMDSSIAHDAEGYAAKAPLVDGPAGGFKSYLSEDEIEALVARFSRDKAMLIAHGRLPTEKPSKKENTKSMSSKHLAQPKDIKKTPRKRVPKAGSGKQVGSAPGERPFMSEPGIIEKAWGPGVSSEERRRLIESPHSSRYLPMFRSMIAAQAAKNSSPAARNRSGKTSSPITKGITLRVPTTLVKNYTSQVTNPIAGKYAPRPPRPVFRSDTRSKAVAKSYTPQAPIPVAKNYTVQDVNSVAKNNPPQVLGPVAKIYTPQAPRPVSSSYTTQAPRPVAENYTPQTISPAAGKCTSQARSPVDRTHIPQIPSPAARDYTPDTSHSNSAVQYPNAQTESKIAYQIPEDISTTTTTTTTDQDTDQTVHDHLVPENFPPNTIFYGGAAFAPAAGSSSDTFLPSPLLFSSAYKPIKDSDKGQACASAVPKPLTAVASKRAATTSAKTATKVVKKNSKSTTSGRSTPTKRSLQQLYEAQFHTLTHEEKCRLVLPLLQGINPDTFQQSNPQSHVASGEVSATISADTIGRNLSTAPVSDHDSAMQGLDQEDAQLMAMLIDRLGHYGDGGSVTPIATTFPLPAQPNHAVLQDAVNTSVSSTLDSASFAMAQEAAAELGPGAFGGATRQHVALQRSETRRR